MKQHTIGARILAALLPLVCAAGFAMPAAADYPPALVQAALASMKAGAYHVEMTEILGPQTIKAEGDVQSLSPMKMRMTTNMGAQGTIAMVVLAPDTYMKTGAAPWKKFAGNPQDYAQMSIGSILKQKHNVTVTDLGVQPKGHGYRIYNADNKTTSTVYLDGSNRLVRMEDPHIVMVISHYGESLNIAPPM